MFSVTTVEVMMIHTAPFEQTGVFTTAV